LSTRQRDSVNGAEGETAGLTISKRHETAGLTISKRHEAAAAAEKNPTFKKNQVMPMDDAIQS
jgi:hypothetical protein